MSANDPAFPQPATSDGHAANTPYAIAGGGMSLLDYFAARAMQVEFMTACLSGPNADALIEGAEAAGMTIPQRISHNAYEIAEAMLVERAKRQQERP
jgi:hypothetical protein